MVSRLHLIASCRMAVFLSVNFVLGQFLESENHCRVIQVAVPLSGDTVEQLLRGGCIGQGHMKFPRIRKRQVQVLLVK